MGFNAYGFILVSIPSSTVIWDDQVERERSSSLKRIRDRNADEKLCWTGLGENVYRVFSR